MSTKTSYLYIEPIIKNQLLAYAKNRMAGEIRQRLDNLQPQEEDYENIVIAAWEEFLKNKKKLRYLHYYKLWATRHKPASRVWLIRIIKRLISAKIARWFVVASPEELQPDDEATLANIEIQLQNKGLKQQEITFLKFHLAGVFANYSKEELAKQWNYQQKKAITIAKYEKTRRRIIKKMQQRAGTYTNWFSTI